MLLKFWKVTWLFMNYETTMTGRLSFSALRAGIESYRPPIPLSNEEEACLQYGVDLIGSPEIN